MDYRLIVIIIIYLTEVGFKIKRSKWKRNNERHCNFAAYILHFNDFESFIIYNIVIYNGSLYVTVNQAVTLGNTPKHLNCYIEMFPQPSYHNPTFTILIYRGNVYHRSPVTNLTTPYILPSHPFKLHWTTSPFVQSTTSRFTKLPIIFISPSATI